MGMSGHHGGNGREMMSEINVTPFVDVMLVLLIIFMVTAPLMTTGMSVDLPRVDAPPLPTAEKQMILSINAEGEYFINKHSFKIEELEPKLRAIIKANPKQEIFLSADGKVAYEKVAALVALCTKVGVPRMGLVTQPKGAR
jgi:biopolymer transport protein TolR